MLKCLLFGHEPHPTLNTAWAESSPRGYSRRLTCCLRCDAPIWAEAPDDRPDGFLSPEERDAVLVDTIVARLLPHTLKRKRAEKKSGSPALTETET